MRGIGVARWIFVLKFRLIDPIPWQAAISAQCVRVCRQIRMCKSRVKLNPPIAIASIILILEHAGYIRRLSGMLNHIVRVGASMDGHISSQQLLVSRQDQKAPSDTEQYRPYRSTRQLRIMGSA